MDYFLLGVSQILQATQNLRNYQLCLLLLNLFCFFEIVVEVRSTAQLQDGAETIVINLNSVKMLHHSSIIQLFVNLILPQSMLDVVILHLVIPAIVKVMDLAGNFAAIFEVKSLVHL